MGLILDILKQALWPIVSALIRTVKKVLAIKSFEQKYRDWLIEKYIFLNVRGIKTNAPVAIELERVFISLRTKKPAHRTRLSGIEPKIKEEDIEKKPELEEFLERRAEESEEEKTYELKDLFNLPRKRFIIIGAPGSGKTTLVNYLSLKFARRSEKELFGIENEILPVFINLRDTAKEDFLDVSKFAENYNNYIECPHSAPEDFFKKKLHEGNCIILLDGLDEVAKEEQRVKVARWVDQLATAYPRNIFIATSRPYGYETARLYNDFVELRILDFTPEQVEQFIKYWTKAVEIKARGDESEFTLEEAERKAADLLKAIKDNPKIEVLTVNPLLLSIVSLVHRYRATLPKRRVELYEECCDVILGYWDLAKGIAGELQPRQKRTILQPLAYDLHLNGLREERKEKLIELLENELPKIGVSKDKASDLLQDIRDRCGILVETKLGYFGFAHQTFQEFLTARHILDNELEDFLTSKRRDKYWLEVTLLYCGMKDTTNLLKKILGEKEDIFHTNLFLAGRCLAESLSVNPELRAKITQRLFNIYWSKNEFDLSKVTVLEIFMEVKDPQIIQKFIFKTVDKESHIRGRAALALGEIQAEESVMPLIELLKDKESYVRGSAAYALGQIQAKEAVAPLIELLKDKESDVRGSATDALGEIQAEKSVMPLIELLKDKESDVRGSAALALGKIQAEESVMPLIELLKDKESYVSELAAYALGKIQAEKSVMPLIELLKDSNIELVGSTALALFEIQGKDAVPHVIPLLEDRRSEVRLDVATALLSCQRKQAVSHLIKLLEDQQRDIRAREREIRARAAFLLGSEHIREAVPLLIRLLKDKDSLMRWAAIAALNQLEAKEGVPVVIDLLKDRHGIVRGAVVDFLGKMESELAVPHLIKLLNDKDSKYNVVGRAAQALGRIQTDKALPHLVKLLRDKRAEVREYAAAAIGEIGIKHSVEDLKVLLQDGEFNVRESAFKALKKISEKNGITIYPD